MMFRTINVLYVLILIIPFYCTAQSFSWVKQYGVLQGREDSYKIFSDNKNGFYVTGTYGTDFYYGSFYLPGSGAFLARHDSAGTALWVRNILFCGELYGAADMDGNVFISSSNGNSTVLKGINNEITLTNKGNGDLFYAKYDSTGEILWAKNIGTAECHEFNTSVVVSFDRSAIFTLKFSGWGCPPRTDIYKVDSYGNIAWHTVLDGSLNLPKLVIDSSGNIYLAAVYWRFLFNEQLFDATTNAGTLAILKLSPSGDVIWTKQDASNGQEYNLYSYIDLQVSSDGLFITSGHNSPILLAGQTLQSTSPDALSMFVAKYSLDGEPLWVKSNNSNHGNALGITADGGVLAAGKLWRTSDVHGTSVYTGKNNDFFFIRYDQDGNVKWIKPPKGTEGLSCNRVSSIFCKNGYCYITGQTSGVTVFDSDTISVDSDHRGDLFIAKLKDESQPQSLKDQQPATFEIWPNPSNGFVNIRSSELFHELQCYVYDPHGSVIRFYILSNMKNYSIDLSTEANGLYLIELIWNDQRISEKIILQR